MTRRRSRVLKSGFELDYTHPAHRTGSEHLYLRIPTVFWLKGYDIAREKPWSGFPAERAPQ